MYKVYKLHELLKYGQDQASTLHMGWKKLPLRLRPNGHTLLPVEVALWAGAYECAAFASTDDEADVLENQPPGRYTLHEDARILQTALCVATLDPDGFFRAQFARTLLPRYIPDSLAAADEEGGSTIFDVAAGRLTAHDFLEETVTAQAMCNLFDVLLGGRSVRNSKGASTSKRGARFVYAGEPTSPMDGVQKSMQNAGRPALTVFKAAYASERLCGGVPLQPDAGWGGGRRPWFRTALLAEMATTFIDTDASVPHGVGAGADERAAFAQRSAIASVLNDAVQPGASAHEKKQVLWDYVVNVVLQGDSFVQLGILLRGSWRALSAWDGQPLMLMDSTFEAARYERFMAHLTQIGVRGDPPPLPRSAFADRVLRRDQAWTPDWNGPAERRQLLGIDEHNEFRFLLVDEPVATHGRRPVRRRRARRRPVLRRRARRRQALLRSPSNA